MWWNPGSPSGSFYSWCLRGVRKQLNHVMKPWLSLWHVWEFLLMVFERCSRAVESQIHFSSIHGVWLWEVWGHWITRPWLSLWEFLMEFQRCFFRALNLIPAMDSLNHYILCNKIAFLNSHLFKSIPWKNLTNACLYSHSRYIEGNYMYNTNACL
jgi:hypothetical protein